MHVQANGLLQAKVDMLRDNLKAARTDTAGKARLEAEVARLNERQGGSSSMADALGALKTSRSTSEDELGSQTQLWIQLVSSCIVLAGELVTLRGLILWRALAGRAAEGELAAGRRQPWAQRAAIACQRAAV